MTDLQPIGIYTIPEISPSSARTEDELTRDAVPFEVGISRYRELARGQIVGDSYGMLKLLVSHRRPRSCSACTSSAPAPPSSSTSGRR